MKVRFRLIEGFSLIEVTLALGIAAVSLCTIFGLLVAGTQTSHTSVEQTAAADVLTAIAGDLRATPRTSPPGQTATSPLLKIAIPANPIGAASSPPAFYFNALGQSSTQGASFPVSYAARYQAIVTFLPNASARSATMVRIRVTWPAKADPTSNLTSAAETLVALDRN